MSKGGGKKKGSIWGWIILLILLSQLLDKFGWIFSIVIPLAVIALFVFIIRVIIKATREENGKTEKKDPVDVRTQGTYPKQPVSTTSTSARTGDQTGDNAVQTPRPKPVKKEPVYSPEVQAVVDEGRRAHTQLEHLYATIPDLGVKAKIRELIDVSDKIIEDAKEDPSDVPQIKKFLDYYLPTTIKLLNAYDRMGAQGIDGENISGTMQSIEEMLDTAVAAYKKLLDSLFANQALDVETDIQVMNTMLQREGLAGEGMPGLGKR